MAELHNSQDPKDIGMTALHSLQEGMTLTDAWSLNQIGEEIIREVKTSLEKTKFKDDFSLCPPQRREDD